MAATGCHLGNGIKHVVQLVFDNVHFFKDNPNVPSDLQMMPNLLHFFEHNGTLLSNSHTPLIASTVVRVRCRISASVPVSAVRPSRMIVTRSDSASASARMWLDSSTVRPPCRSA